VKVALRPARDGDDDLVARVFASTREQELAPLPWTAEQKAAFLAQQAAAQRLHYDSQYAGAAWDVILVDGRPAGRMIVHRADTEITVVDIALLPEHRGHGVGTTVLREILAEADTSALVVRAPGFPRRG
jgi:GNAT superfamily N-acetyltransferase